MEHQIIQLERAMWEAALHKNADAFRALVSPNAVMVCGGYRCLGSEYANFLQDFDITGYSIGSMELIHETENEVTLHYVIRIHAGAQTARDLQGLFHVASMWEKSGDAWNLIFNMDSRIVEEY